MKALCWHGKKDIRCDTVPDPKIEEARIDSVPGVYGGPVPINMGSIVQKGLSAEVVSDPATFTRFIGNVAKHVTVDNSLSDDEIRRTALSLRLSGNDIELLQAPLSGFGTSPDGQSIDIVDTARLLALLASLDSKESEKPWTLNKVEIRAPVNPNAQPVARVELEHGHRGRGPGRRLRAEQCGGARDGRARAPGRAGAHAGPGDGRG